MNAAAVICPYCRTPVLDDDAESPKVLCPGCGAAHHADCFEENGGCTIFGCSAAPPDEPKLSIASSETHSLPSPAVATQPFVFNTPLMPLDPNEPPPPPAAPPVYDTALMVPPKSRTTYILLGVLLGFFGAHSFYAGYNKRGVIQLAITLCTLGFAAFGTWVWAIIDICTISQDYNGVHFRD